MKALQVLRHFIHEAKAMQFFSRLLRLWELRRVLALDELERVDQSEPCKTGRLAEMHMKNKKEEYCQGMTQKCRVTGPLIMHARPLFLIGVTNLDSLMRKTEGRAGAAWRNEDVAESSYGAGLGDGRMWMFEGSLKD